MTKLFLKVVNTSISASWLILAVLICRLVLKKAPKWVNVLLWGIAAVRLLFPFSVESALSLIPSAETIAPEIMMDASPTINTGIPAINNVVNPVISQSFAPSPTASANPLQIWIPVLAVAWVIGVVGALAYTAATYWRLSRKVGTAVLLRNNIFQSESVSSPFVLGIIKPKVYLPFKLDGQDMGHVIAHELAHIRRRDHWWKPLGFLLLVVYWFNPLMWLAYALLCRDIELACDEKVIKDLGNEQRADYTQALLTCSVSRPMISACPLAFGEVGVKERVKSVMHYKKPAFWIIVLSVVACAAVAVCFLTDPVAPTEISNKSTPEFFNDIGKTLSELKNEYPEGEFIVSLDGFPDSAAACFGEPGAEYVYFFFGGQSGDFERAMNECEEQIKCSGFITTANILFNEMEDDMSFEDFFSMIGVEDYEYFGEDTITAEGWLRFTYNGMEVMVNTNEAAAGGGWNVTGAEIVKSNAPVSIVDPEILNTNQDLAEPVMFD